MLFFFFQAEDGIRDSSVTGVQTCLFRSPSAALVHVVTDVLDVDVSLAGGELTRADLPAYAQVKGGQARVRLLNRDSEQSLFVVQSGLSGAAGTAMPDHLALFDTAARELKLGA